MYNDDTKANGSLSEKSSQPANDRLSVEAVNSRKVVRKVDFAVVPLMALLYLLSSLDRTNIGNARLAGLQQDLNLNGHNYRVALSVTYVPYILAEIPSNLILKKVGPDRWIPTLVVLWGVVTAVEGCVTSFHGLLVARYFFRHFSVHCITYCLLVLFQVLPWLGRRWHLSWHRPLYEYVVSAS